ncbi:fibronectin type III [Tersicoccus solisilvae]|uniref:Fibronectin type III n=1 Tax=Tersicoccus solisilvae TaxID=1882339 RepID=A0ABQ1PQ51_9MICC|nr:Ig-like domain-containing protein [Tersicoccus solisilvae]GGD00896.1 fibronectin type III [Tersicoccus solisilvae]
MKLLAGFRGRAARRRRAVVSTITLAVVTAVLVAGAVLHPGFTTADVDLHDGGVWVTNSSRNLVGHLNYQSKLLDGGVVAGSPDFDVLQAGARVLVSDADRSALTPLDPASVALGADQKIPGDARLSFGTTVVAIADPQAGTVWAVPADRLGSFDPDGTTPVIEKARGVVAAVGTDDTVHVADVAGRKLLALHVDDQGEVTDRQESGLDGLTAADTLQVSAVGEKPVLFDAATGTLHLPGGRTATVPDGRNGKLQLPSAGKNGAGNDGAGEDTVVVATGKDLVRQPLDGGEPTRTANPVAGTPAAPVQLAGCVHAAWAGSGQYVRECANGADSMRRDIPSLAARADLQFRVNRDVVVLNDVAAGNTWLVQQDMELVNNWQDIIPPPDVADEAKDDSHDESVERALPDRTKPNRPPVAANDTFGVRPGRTTTLPIMDNDSDPDGDVLTASVAGQGPDLGTVQPIYDSTGLQIAVPDGARGTGVFRYAAADGRGKTATATVRVAVRGPDENGAPRPKRPADPTTIPVQQGRSVNQNILSDWTDPDGDDLFLVSAAPTKDGDRVRARPDGLLTYQDVDKSSGKKEVAIVVSDGRTTTEGTVIMDVKPTSALAPVATPDHITVRAGESATVAPLKNDLDPAGGTLRMPKVNAVPGTTVTPNYEAGTFAFRANAPGTYYLEYLANNGPKSTVGLVRADVVPSTAEGGPVAVRDTALLPAHQDVLVDVLGNDSDPAGGVLVVQSVSATASSPVSVAIVDHNVLRIADVRGITAPVTVSYTISNGTQTATGEVNVVPVAPPAKLQPPEAAPDEVTVRVGDVATIPVLGNDKHPQNDALHLDPKLTQVPDPAVGRTWVAQDTVRFLAADTPGSYRAIYNVVDSRGQKDSAQVTIRVKARDDEHNGRPQPKNLTARVLAGGTIRIPVPLDGVDPEGDSVRISDVDRAPAKGTAILGADYIDYTAAGSATGTDSFTYEVRDRLGARATASVLVGVAPPTKTNQVPVPVADAVSVRPGRQVAVDAIHNDNDPDGDQLALVENGLEAPDGVAAQVRRGKVVLTAPATEGPVAVRYAVRDSRGARAVGTIRLDVSATAPLVAPVAQDDRVEVAATMGKNTVQVPVLDNDADPDGIADALDVSFPGNVAGVGFAEGKAAVPLAEAEQLVPYTVTDVDGQTGTALIWVPGRADQYPTLVSRKAKEVTAGQRIDIDLAREVRVRDGRTVRITEVSGVKAIGAAPGDLVVDENTLRYQAADDFYGPGSVTFEVTDGSGPDDPEGRTSTLTIMIGVLPKPAENHPPTFAGGSMTVAQAEPAAEFDLAPAATDVDAGDKDRLRYTLEGTRPDDLIVSLEGSRLKVSAKDSAVKNTAVPIQVAVTDGRSDPVTGTVTVAVVSSSRPLAVVNDDVVPDARAGSPTTVDVLTNDVSPFPGSPLSIVDVVRETGPGTVTVSGSRLTVTPQRDFAGTMVVRYTVSDRTGDADRQVDGAVRLTVKARPDAPSTPRAVETRSHTVVLNWAPPSDNGSPITGYTVTGTGGFRQQCASTTCTLAGLVNDREYTFAVTARNAVGESDASPTSGVSRPDQRPDQPAAPRLRFGDGRLDVAWTPPHVDGSPVSSYDLEISPAPPSGAVQRPGLTTTAYTWTGLSNGTAYQVRVRAHNKAKDPSDFSGFSASEVPAGRPGAPASVTTQRVSSVGSQNQIAVSWAAAAPNGDPIESYTLSVLRGGSTVQTIPVSGGRTAQTVTVPNAEADYTFRVVAKNKAGTGAVSAPSAPRRAFGAPQAVSSVALSPANTDTTGGQVRVDFTPLTPAQRNGAQAGEVSYRFSASTGQSGAIRPGQVLSGFANGQATTVTVVAESNANGARYTSPGRASNSTRPHGRPGTPATSGSNGTRDTRSDGTRHRATVRWSPPGNADVARLEVRVDGGGWENVGTAAGSRTFTDHNRDHRVDVRAVNSVGTAGSIATTSVRTGDTAPPPPPPPPVPEKTRVQVEKSTNNSCTQAPGEPDNFTDNPATCDGVRSNGAPNPPGKWISWADGPVSVDRCGSPFGGQNAWYHMTSGPHDGRWVKAATVDHVSGPRIACTGLD